jgi:hypothetical protein
MIRQVLLNYAKTVRICVFISFANHQLAMVLVQLLLAFQFIHTVTRLVLEKDYAVEGVVDIFDRSLEALGI